MRPHYHNKCVSGMSWPTLGFPVLECWTLGDHISHPSFFRLPHRVFPHIPSQRRHLAKAWPKPEHSIGGHVLFWWGGMPWGRSQQCRMMHLMTWWQIYIYIYWQTFKTQHLQSFGYIKFNSYQRPCKIVCNTQGLIVVNMVNQMLVSEYYSCVYVTS
jgi:hypothetical protein